MRTITLTAENEQDYELVLKLAQRLGLDYREETLAAPAAASAPPTPPDLSHLSREELLAILDQGGDGQSIPDPLAWQREERDWDDRLAWPKP
jgi:hypothetical protein